MSLTDAEADRVSELVRDIASGAVPWMIALAVVLVVTWTWTSALAARVAARIDSGTVDQVTRADDAADSIRRAPVVLASMLALIGITLGALLATFAPLLLVLGLGGGGGAVAVAAVFGVPAALVLSVWFYVRLGLATPLAAIGGHGIGIRRSWELTGGHFWGVLGRLLVAGLIAGVATFPLSFVNSFSVVFGFGVWLFLVLLLQAASSVIGVLVTVARPGGPRRASHRTTRRADRLMGVVSIDHVQLAMPAGEEDVCDGVLPGPARDPPGSQTATSPSAWWLLVRAARPQDPPRRRRRLPSGAQGPPRALGDRPCVARASG